MVAARIDAPRRYMVTVCFRLQQLPHELIGIAHLLYPVVWDRRPSCQGSDAIRQILKLSENFVNL